MWMHWKRGLPLISAVRHARKSRGIIQIREKPAKKTSACKISNSRPFLMCICFRPSTEVEVSLCKTQFSLKLEFRFQISALVNESASVLQIWISKDLSVSEKHSFRLPSTWCHHAAKTRLCSIGLWCSSQRLGRVMPIAFGGLLFLPGLLFCLLDSMLNTKRAGCTVTISITEHLQHICGRHIPVELSEKALKPYRNIAFGSTTLQVNGEGSWKLKEHNASVLPSQGIIQQGAGDHWTSTETKQSYRLSFAKGVSIVFTVQIPCLDNNFLKIACWNSSAIHPAFYLGECNQLSARLAVIESQLNQLLLGRGTSANTQHLRREGWRGLQCRASQTKEY